MFFGPVKYLKEPKLFVFYKFRSGSFGTGIRTEYVKLVKDQLRRYSSSNERLVRTCDRYEANTHPVHHSGEHGEQPVRRAPATGDVGRGGPGDGHPARVHVPLLAGQPGRGGARDVPRAVAGPRQFRVELQLGDDGRPVFAHPAAVQRHGHRHQRRHHGVLGLAVPAV